MKRPAQRFIALSLLAIACGFVSVVSRIMPQEDPTPQQQSQQQQDALRSPEQRDKTIVDYIADETRFDAKIDSTIRLIGNVVFHHNGAIIQCDSAYRYDEMRMDCFGRVIINKDSTFIYGDKASYDGNIDLATVYSPLIKMVNGEVTMYTFNMQFNTLTSIGTFWGGAMVTRGDNLMESQRGIYDSRLNTVKFMDDVALSSDNYIIKTDSASYNIDTEVITFLSRPYIWDHQRDFLTAERGEYHAKSETYTFTDNAYALTPEREMWADTMQYLSPMKEAYMQSNIQITDTVQKTLAFGDWGYYSDSTKNAILTRIPSIVSYESKTDSLGRVSADSSYMSADSIFMYSFPAGGSKLREGDFLSHSDVVERLDSVLTADSVMVAEATDSLARARLRDRELADSIRMENNRPIIEDRSHNNELFPPEKQTESEPAREVVLPAGQSPDTLQKESAIESKASKRLERRAIRAAEKVTKEKEKIEAETLRQAEKALQQETEKTIPETGRHDNRDDSTHVHEGEDPLWEPAIANERDEPDSGLIDSLTTQRSAPVDSTKQNKRDSLERVVKAYHNVKMYRSDFQAIADSTISFSVDSTMYMFGRPLLWSEKSQLSSDEIAVYSKDGEVDWVDFIGSPFIAEEVDSDRFNQASGKRLRAFFKDSEIDFAVMSQNVMNYYYKLDEYNEVTEFATITCADMRTDFINREVARINWMGKPEWTIFPIRLIPADQPTRLEGFEWHPERRPMSSKEIFDRRIRESERVKWDSLPQPTFAISERINLHKEDIISRGIWVDRIDIPRVTAEFFLSGEHLRY